MQANDRIYIAGHGGMVGSAMVRLLRAQGYRNLLIASRTELDLRITAAVNAYFEQNRPQYVFLAAAKVGGIMANSLYPAEFIYDNLLIQSNVIHAAHLYGVEKLLFLGSSCIYPKMCRQPIREEYLLEGALEPTNEAYAIAKIAGLKMCAAYRQQYGCNFISAMPTNLYGPGDNYDPQNSHVLPALLRKFHEAKATNASEVMLWGSGTPKREFLHVDDLAVACLLLMQRYNESQWINIGTGKDVSIAELAQIIKKTVGYEGNIRFDLSKPDGTPRKLLDVSKIRALGWRHNIELEEGIRQVYGNKYFPN